MSKPTYPLKPCPFCGGRAKIRAVLLCYEEWHVACARCEAETLRAHAKCDAAAAWNRRAEETTKK